MGHIDENILSWHFSSDAGGGIYCPPLGWNVIFLTIWDQWQLFMICRYLHHVIHLYCFALVYVSTVNFWYLLPEIKIHSSKYFLFYRSSIAIDRISHSLKSSPSSNSNMKAPVIVLVTLVIYLVLIKMYHPAKFSGYSIRHENLIQSRSLKQRTQKYARKQKQRGSPFNDTTAFYIRLLLLCGDVETNPGPTSFTGWFCFLLIGNI